MSQDDTMSAIEEKPVERDLAWKLRSIADASVRANGSDTPLGQTIREAAATVEALKAEIARLTAERDAAEFAARNGRSLSEDSIAAIRELLKHHGVPTSAFIDDHVGNAIAQRDEARAQLSVLKEESRRVMEPTGEIECHGLDTPERVCFYEQDFYVLSNFSSFSLRMWGGIRFDTSEAAYHWAKFNLELPASREVQNNIYHARSAHDTFKIAERNKHLRRPDWDDVKIDIMRDILRAKADQHEYVSRKLESTGDRELVENSWRDDFWGWGPNRDGKNMLGKLWMEIRAERRAARALADKLGREG